MISQVVNHQFVECTLFVSFLIPKIVIDDDFQIP